jgi:hypothetical protein
MQDTSPPTRASAPQNETTKPALNRVDSTTREKIMKAPFFRKKKRNPEGLR